MEIRDLPKKDFPPLLNEINDPPKSLRIVGEIPQTEKYLAVVGSRKYSEYGKAVCEKLIEGLRGYPITIVSGLALGMDSIAHRAALKAGLPTIAIPGSGLDEKAIYPSTHLNLAKEIVESGGCLLSEFEPDFKATNWSFIQRNRIGAGLSDAVLLIEAEEKSGTLTTARLATDYNREVLVVPGNISSPTSKGTNELLAPKEPKEIVVDLPDEEYFIFKLLSEPKSKEELAMLCEKPISEVNILVSMLELRGLIKEVDGKIHRR